MTAGSPRPLLAFLAGPFSPDYGRRLARLRWKRAIAGDEVELTREASAERVFARASEWILVRQEEALPLAQGEFPRLGQGRVLLVRGRNVSDFPPVHTLRELEGLAPSAGAGAEDSPCCALAFSTQDFAPGRGETVIEFVERLLAPTTPREYASGFSALLPDDPFGHDRPELTRLFPRGIRRLLDVGCGAGLACAALKTRIPQLTVTGVERDPGAAARARLRLDRVLEGEAEDALARLSAAGERYDAFLFADVLEHLLDPIGLLVAARPLAVPEARLIASVPNVGHLSIVRDLLLGRFDPLPAGLADAGHLRWFTRSFLAEALEEAGWRVVSIESSVGAPAPGADEFFARLSGWANVDRESLTTYQWVAVAVPA